jgi:hypothetical protein
MAPFTSAFLISVSLLYKEKRLISLLLRDALHPVGATGLFWLGFHLG